MSTFAIDRIRNQARVLEAGATVVPMTSDTLSIPRLATGVTAAWKAENAPVTQSDPAFERVVLDTKTLAVQVILSYELMEDMTSTSSDLITNELTQALALELDAKALRGDGTSNAPLGVRNQSGITIQSLGTNGASPTYDALVTADSTLSGLNFDANAAILNPRTAKTLALLKDSTGQPLRPSPAIDDLTILETNQVPTTLVQGSSSVASEIYVGDWSQLLIGVRPQIGVRIVRSDYRYVDQLSVVLVAYLRADVQVSHPAAFAVVTGVTP